MGVLHPLRWLIVGAVLLFIGAGLPLLMVLRILEPTFLLSFISFAASTGGFLVGFVGMAFYGVRMRG